MSSGVLKEITAEDLFLLNQWCKRSWKEQPLYGCDCRLLVRGN